MKTSHIQYDPANDTHITTLFLDRDEEGDFLDVDSSLMHSAEHGYYLARKIIQVWMGVLGKQRPMRRRRLPCANTAAV